MSDKPSLLSSEPTQSLIEAQAFSSRVSMLQEVATAINSCLNLGEILQVVSQQAKWLLDFDYCSLSLYEKQTVKQFPIYSRLPHFHALESEIVELSLQTNQLQHVMDSLSGRFDSLYRSWIVIPLRREEMILGTFNIAAVTPNQFRQEDLRITYLLALSLAAAIHNAQQYAEIQRLYQQLEVTVRDLRLAERSRDELTNMIIHDLGNPLTVINGTLDLLAQRSSTDLSVKLYQRLLQNAFLAGERMMGLIEDLLMVSRMETQQWQLDLVAINLVELLTPRLSGYEAQAELDGKQFQAEMPASSPLILADKKLIGRVLDNLVGNALKYTAPDGWILLEVSLAETKVQLKIQDNGMGIPPDYLERIFDKYVQVTDSSGKPLRKGVGLGLTFCRQVVEAHRGKIWVESELAVGSAFYFTLPLAAHFSQPPTYNN